MILNVMGDPYMQTAPRRNRRSTEVEIVPLEKLPRLSQDIQIWISDIERRFTHQIRRHLSQYAVDIGIPAPTMRRLWAGDTQSPSVEACRKIARYFAGVVAQGFTPPADADRIDQEEVILEIAGHRESYNRLKEVALIVRPDIAQYLDITDLPEWQTSHLGPKLEADKLLSSGMPLDQKIERIAFYALQWLNNPANGVTREKLETMRLQLANG